MSNRSLESEREALLVCDELSEMVMGVDSNAHRR